MATASGNYIVESDVDNWDDAVSTTETFATSDVVIATDKITVTNDIDTGSLIRFTSTGVVPAPLVSGTAYYAINSDATHIQVATNPVNAAAGTQIDLTDVGSDTHTLDVGEGSSTSDRQEVINRAEQLIEEITKDYFYSKDFIEYVNGNNKDRLLVSLIPDILTVTEIKISNIVLTTDWWTYDTNFVYLDPEAVTGDASDLAELHLRLKYERNLFPKGMKNIKITGTYGWNSVPPAIKLATIKLCLSENDSTLFTTYNTNLKSEKLGDYSYTLVDPEAGSTSTQRKTGINEVDKLLKHYLRRKPMMSII